MNPVKFKEHNTVFAKNQPEYRQLPAFVQADGTAIFLWSMTWRERVRALLTGKIWHTVLTFNHPLQPQLLSLDSPFEVQA